MATETGDFAERREELLQSIEHDEEELREAVHELAEVAEEKLDFAGYIRESPLTWVVGAFCVGMWLGMSNERRPQHELIDYRRRR